MLTICDYCCWVLVEVHTAPYAVAEVEAEDVANDEETQRKDDLIDCRQDACAQLREVEAGRMGLKVERCLFDDVKREEKDSR
jgi:hypothetical protein